MRCRLVATAAWPVAIGVTLVLALKRYHAAVAGKIGADFDVLWRAAAAVHAGRSIYRTPFFYPPTLPLLLAPFVHSVESHAWRTWTAIEVVALVIAAGVFVAGARLRGWRRPTLLAFCAVSMLHFWPVTVGLFLGQTDALVFLVLVGASVMVTRDRPIPYGVLLGLGALLKGWPVLIGVALLQRGLKGRRRALLAFGATLIIAPMSILASMGFAALGQFVSNNLDARSQPLVSDSVWGIPKLLFSRSGLARPVVVSASDHVAATLVLLVLVAGLLVIALRMSGDPGLCLANVTLCVVLLLPISHRAYSLYALPLLWLWTIRATRPNRTRSDIVVAVVLLGWWVVLAKSWPDTGSSPAISSVRFCVPFAANLVAVTVSSIGAWLVDRRVTRFGVVVADHRDVL